MLYFEKKKEVFPWPSGYAKKLNIPVWWPSETVGEIMADWNKAGEKMEQEWGQIMSWPHALRPDLVFYSRGDEKV